MKKIFFLLIAAVAISTVVTVNSCKKDDTTPPVITVTGDNPATVVLGTAYNDAGATGHDDNDGNVTVSSSGTVDVNTEGSYTITYAAADAAGNQATAHRTVNVVITRANYVWAAYSCNDSCTTNSTIGAFAYSGNIAAGTAADAIVISNFSGTLQNCIATVSGHTVTIASQTVGAFTIVGSGTMNNHGTVMTIDYSASSTGTDNFHAIFTKQ